MAAARNRHQVTATMIVAKVPGAAGGEIYLRRGALLPSTVTPEEIKRLDSLGLIEKATETPPTADKPAGENPAGEKPEGEKPERVKPAAQKAAAGAAAGAS